MPYWRWCGVQGPIRPVARIGTRSRSLKDPVTTVLQLPFAWRNVRSAPWSGPRSGLRTSNRSHCSARRHHHAGNSRRIAAREQFKNPRGVSAERPRSVAPAWWGTCRKVRIVDQVRPGKWIVVGGEIACRGGRRRPGRLHLVNAIWIKVLPGGAGPGILDDGPEVYLGKRGVPTLGGARSSSRCGGQLLSRCVSVVSAGCTPSLIRRSDVSSPQTPELAEVDWGAGSIPL
jgi:hypothetical protein